MWHRPIPRPVAPLIVDAYVLPSAAKRVYTQHRQGAIPKEGIPKQYKERFSLQGINPCYR